MDLAAEEIVMQRAIRRFLAFQSEEKEASSHTLSAYRADLNQFHGFLETRLPSSRDSVDTSSWENVSSKHVKQYLDHLQRSDYATATVARKIASVKSFFTYLVAQGVVENDPAQNCPTPRVEKSKPYTLTTDEVNRLFAAAARGKTPKLLRDQALLQLLYATGIRVSELVALDVEHVDLEARNLESGVDSSRRRTLPLNDDAAATLHAYLKDGRPRLLSFDGGDALFLNHRGRRLTRQGLWLIIRTYVRAVGVSARVTPLTLRHSFASHQLAAGANLHEVQRRLGHASPATTQLYRTRDRRNGIEILGSRSEKKESGSSSN